MTFPKPVDGADGADSTALMTRWRRRTLVRGCSGDTSATGNQCLMKPEPPAEGRSLALTPQSQECPMAAGWAGAGG